MAKLCKHAPQPDSLSKTFIHGGQFGFGGAVADRPSTLRPAANCPAVEVEEIREAEGRKRVVRSEVAGIAEAEELDVSFAS